MKLKKVIQLTEEKMLKLFKVLVDDEGEEQEYYLASRRPIDKLVISKEENRNICDGIVILANTSEEEVILMKQPCPLVNDFVYGLPMGILSEDESIEECVQREIVEQTGLSVADSTILIRNSYNDTSMTDERLIVVEASVFGDLDPSISEDNGFDICKVALKDIPEFIASHTIEVRDSALLLYLYYKNVDTFADLEPIEL